MDELVFTPSAVMAFLSSIKELEDYDIDVQENESSITFNVGESTYTIEKSSAEEIEVDEEVVDEVGEINDSEYEALENEEPSEEVEGGLIKELVKTLALGGLIRLTKNALKNA